MTNKFDEFQTKSDLPGVFCSWKGMPLNITSHSPSPKKRVFLRIILLLVFGILSSITTLCIYTRYYSLKGAFLPLSVTEPERLELLHHHPKQPARIHVPHELDACNILMECFPGDESIYRDLPTCHKNMPFLLTNFDSSVFIQDNQIIGFLSFHLQAFKEYRHIAIYNVCVARHVRRKGLAKRMITEGLQEMISKYKLDTGKLLVGLDVDLTTSMAAETFSLYAKMGFLRAWQACPTIGNVDWRYIAEGRDMPAAKSPLSLLIDNPEKFVKQNLTNPDKSTLLPPLYRSSNSKLTRFCMFKFYDESWQAMGKSLTAPFSKSTEKTEKEQL